MRLEPGQYQSYRRRTQPRPRHPYIVRLQKAGVFLFGSKKRTIVTLLVVAIVPIVFIQLFYSNNAVLPNTKVGSVAIGGMSKKAATAVLNSAYEATKVPVYFSDSDEVVIRPTLGNLGISVDNTERIASYSYPLGVRFIPYSLFWYHLFEPKGEPTVTRSAEVLLEYIVSRFGEDCEFEPVSATIIYANETLQVQEATRGGSCDPTELRTHLEGVAARLDPERVTIKGTSTAPNIATKTAQEEYDRLVKELNHGVTLKVDDKTETIAQKTVASWVRYSTDNGTLTLGLDTDALKNWLRDTYGKQFTSDAGVTVITLKDYAESTRETGKSGQALNPGQTQTELIKTLRGEQDEAKLVVDTLQPAIEYRRTYSESDAALSTVMKKYASSHSGVYGVKMVELSGSRRNAEYNSMRTFTTASTYKLFVAYSILLRIERGEIAWSDTSYGGLSVSTCFDRMIMLSNNECAVWFLLKVSYEGVTADAHALGATHTNFVRSTGITSTAADEAYFLSLLYTGQLLSQQASRDRLIAAMKGNVYVAGIPTGIPEATIADKVGFLDGLLHDAAIVYSKKGDYVLIIMTDNASWANIAELAHAIEAAR